MIQPVAMGSFTEALRRGVEIFHHLKQVLQSMGLSTVVGDAVVLRLTLLHRPGAGGN